MFSCNNTSSGFADFFKSCKQGPARLKKIGEYLYHYDCQIGSGTYSQVYQGISIQTKKPVAIKVVDLQMVKQKNLSNLLFQQTELLSELNHPNVIKCHALLKSENRCYIVTELCKKDNLETLVEKSKSNKMPTSEIQRIIFDIFQGLLYLSQKAIIHRDLKTANILFSQTGKAKIADFGFATHGLSEFKDNVFVGTPLYMSPQAIIQQKYSPKTDIWSFGIIVYELLFGQTPLSKCKNQDELLSKIVKHTTITPSQKISQSLAQLIQGCLEPNSLYRWNIDKLSKSTYILGLKKKYHIQSNIFEPIKMRKEESETVTAMESRIQDYLTSFNKNQQSSFSSKNIASKNNISSQLKFQKSTKQTMRSPVNVKNYTSLDQDKKTNINHVQSAPFAKKPSKPEVFPANLIKRTHTETHPNPIVIPDRERQSMGYIEAGKAKSKVQFSINYQSPSIQTQPIGMTRVQRQCSLNQQSNKTSKLTLRTVQSGSSHTTLKKTTSQKESPSCIYTESRQMQRKSELPSTHSLFGEFAHNFSLLRSKKLTYKQAICLIHYCRLLHRVLQFPRYFNNYLKKWLIFLVKDLKDNAQVNSLKQTHLQSLRTVLQGYYKQYTTEYKNDIDNKQFIPQIKSVVKILRSLLELDEQNKDKSMEKQLLSYLLVDSVNLEQCLLGTEPSIQSYVKQSKCQLYLDCYNNKDQKSQGLKALKLKQKQK